MTRKKFKELEIGGLFTLEKEGGLFIKTSLQPLDNVVVIVKADVISPVLEGHTSNFSYHTEVVPILDMSFTYGTIVSKTITVNNASGTP